MQISNTRFPTFFLCILILLHAGCSGTDSKAGFSEVGSTETIVNGINLNVDPRIELLATVQFLGGYAEMGRITRYPINYLGEINKHFEPFKNHRAVGLFKEMLKQGFAYDAPVWLVLHYGPLPEMQKLAKPPEDLLQRCGGAEGAEEFITALRDFADKSDFYSFYADHAGFYASLVEGVSSNMEGVRVNDLEDYYGYGQHSYNIILAPLLHHGGYGPRIERNDGSLDVYSVIGPYGATRGIPFFGTPADFEYIVWHEFGHSFINPLVDEHWEQLEPLGSALFEPVKDKFPQSYTTWKICCSEYLVRAIVLRLIDKHQGITQSVAQLLKEKKLGFIAIDALANALIEYEQNREKYPTLKDYMPQLIEVLQRHARKKS